MIEVEKKFILTPEQEKKLIKGAKFLGEKKFTDSYYDDAHYILTGQDIWLRRRDGRFELKLPMNVNIKKRVSDRYKELESDAEILKYFNAAPGTPMQEFLTEKRFVPFCTITTERKKYKKGGFTIDLDMTDFGYAVAEIEYMTDDQSKLQEATDAIIAFAKKHGINTDTLVRGKVVEYLRLNNRAHFDELLVLGVINPQLA